MQVRNAKGYRRSATGQQCERDDDDDSVDTITMTVRLLQRRLGTVKHTSITHAKQELHSAHILFVGFWCALVLLLRHGGRRRNEGRSQTLR